jgi:gliding motility-associated-like protein
MQPFFLFLHLKVMYQKTKKMKKNLLRLLVIAIAFIGFNQTAEASHGAAFEITYKHLGGNQYRIYASFYRECSGISAPSSFSLGYTSSCFTGGNINLPQMAGSGVIVPATCLSSSTVCTREHKYEGTVTLPGKCTDWRFYHTGGCRPFNNNSTTCNYYVYALLNNKDVDAQGRDFNNSPSWNNNVTVRDFCVGKKQFFDQSSTEIDGDSVVYRLAPALQSYYTSILYSAPYDSINQVPTTPAVNGIKVNQLTQSFEFTPSTTFSGSFCFRAEEWRPVMKIINPGTPQVDTLYPRVMVGMIMRDMRVIFGPNCNVVTPYLAGKLNSSGTPLVDNSLGKPYYYQDVPCAATSFNVSMPVQGACGSIEPFGSDFRLYNVTTGLQYGPIVGATPFCNNGKADSINIQMGQGMAMGNYFLIVKTGNDLNTITSDCGDVIQEFEDTVLIKVSGNAAFPLSDQTVCYPTQPYPNLALDPNSTNIIWSYNGSPNGNTSPTQTADTTGTYSVTYTAYGCPGSGSVNITVDKDPVVNFPDTIFRCSPFSPFYLNTGYNNGETHQWQVIVGTNPINLTGAGDSVQITVPNRGYNVTITTAAGCTYTETFWVALTDSVKFNLMATDTIICETESASIRPTHTIPGVTNYNWSINGSPLGINNQTIGITQSGTYKLEVTTDDGCKGSNKLTVEVHPMMPAPEIICNVSDGQLVFSWNAIPGAEGYFVSLDGGSTWVESNGPTSHTISDLNQQSIQVKGFNSSACPVGEYGESSECVKELVVPNVISPNSVDGSNDKFVIPYLELYQDNYLVVFDRWGRKVYEAQPYKNDWDGGKNSDGTYFYILELNDENNKVFKGNVTILK